MANQYAPLPNHPGSDRAPNELEMEAAFDDSDDEDDFHNASENQPLRPSPTSPSIVPTQRQHIPGTYDFENVDYDYPPPGSPPRPSSIALPNSIGNTNGFIPSSDTIRAAPRPSWFRRTAGSVLPTHYARVLGIARPTGVVGGGTNNDGVFANVTAKPSRPLRVVEGDAENNLVPEETQTDAPPSYNSAQADAVPPYWETTVHAPFSPENIGEMIIDSLPTGSLFSFLWNMLISVSFQFVGFLLTYLLHTTHAARLGSRAGLGVTMIQYGFALRGRLDDIGGDSSSGTASWGSWKVDAHPSFNSVAEAEAYYKHHGMHNATAPTPTAEEQESIVLADATTEWLAFFLMTMGWFVLLTSLLGFWRVKRWERRILASQNEQVSTTPQPENAFAPSIQNLFGIRNLAQADLIRNGFGWGSRHQETEADSHEDGIDSTERDLMIPVDPNDPDAQRLIQALATERRLRANLREAGFT